MGKIVHTKGSIGSQGVAQGAVCRFCPGSCATSCMRAGFNPYGIRLDEQRGPFSISLDGFEPLESAASCEDDGGEEDR